MQITLEEVLEYFQNRGVLTEATQGQLGLGGGPPTQQELPLEKKKSGETKISRPKIAITEKWGDPNSQDGAFIKKFASKIPGATLKEKIAKINEIATGGGKTVGEMLSAIMLLDMLSGLTNQFTPSAAGFIFESFLAGLTEGAQVPLDDPGGLSLVDVIKKGPKSTEKEGDDDPVSGYSVKLYGKESPVGGSRNLLYRSLIRYGKVIYFVAVKQKTDDGITGVTIYDFVITKEAVEKRLTVSIEEFYLDWFTRDATDEVKAAVYAKKEEIFKDLAESGIYLTSDKKGGVKPSKVGPSIGPFSIPKSVYEKEGTFDWGVSNGSIGTLGFGEAAMKDIASKYADTFAKQINDIYDVVEMFSTNITNYFLYGNQAAGGQAKGDLTNLSAKTQEAVKETAQS